MGKKMMLNINEDKLREWIFINDNLLMAVQINLFNSEIIPKDNKLSLSSIMQMNNLEEMFLFFFNFSREYLITHTYKIIDFDRRTITIPNFFNSIYTNKQSKEHQHYRNWEVNTKEFREKLRVARHEFSSHSNREALNNQKFFGIYIEDMDNFLEQSFKLCDFLYSQSLALKNEFDNVIGKGLLFAQKPSDIAKIRKNDMARRIKYLRETNNLVGSCL